MTCRNAAQRFYICQQSSIAKVDSLGLSAGAKRLKPWMVLAERVMDDLPQRGTAFLHLPTVQHSQSG
ncbi:hypothetical protein ISG33_00940 [Glaciecola sp. MH2013]|uniref:hypothetical protein n=1 Tax=Glaciecola sp. MH2013 TaxID=2785524 RepID=UPI00189CD33F|nr:hypothetical protein [Glaciecola sp. MH2013]MBF7071964.1 hypothetical protein [Glaciecola sp. MH2013]